jgi:AraC family transcriptional regulator of adaptative response/methylated-DNA-[protein]-cysteine methyltransferase
MTEESRWAAVIRRDLRANGAFFYAVRTTGIYCRPGCASRKPKRGNVEFFDSCKAAERAGYRPCKRCKPDTESPRRRQATIIAHACRRIEESDDPLTLHQLAAEAGMSPWHFHRLFKATVGVTPKQYTSTRRLDRFRDRLENGNSVTEAIYDAGFGSSSRAYEGVGERLGMLPTDYRKGAAGLDIGYAVVRCVLGWVLVAATDRGICAIEFGDDPADLGARLQQRFPNACISKADPAASAWIEQTVGFIEAPERGLDLPLDVHGTAFQQRVWKALRNLPPGTTASYAEVAERIGNPKAVRAVAGACAANKIAVAIPCHRVVRSDGGLGGYRWGAERKRALLDQESRLGGKSSVPR